MFISTLNPLFFSGFLLSICTNHPHCGDTFVINFSCNFIPKFKYGLCLTHEVTLKKSNVNKIKCLY